LTVAPAQRPWRRESIMIGAFGLEGNNQAENSKMKKILYASLAIAALVASPALAADMRAPVVKAPPMPAPIYTWTGCYIGGNVGWGRTETRITDFETGLDDGRHTADGIVGGGQVGCDYQFASNWVLG